MVLDNYYQAWMVVDEGGKNITRSQEHKKRIGQ